MKKKLPATPAEIKNLFNEKGVRPTVHRLAIAEYIFCIADHPDAEEVRLWAEENLPTVSKGTIYNTLNELIDAGLIRQYRFPHSTRLIYDGNTEPHHHFFDSDSDTLIDIDPEKVSIKADLDDDFEVEEVNILFRGKRKK